MPTHRVAGCCRKPHGQAVAVVTCPASQSAVYVGLWSCGSVWACAVCATRISERRRKELSAAVMAWESRGGRVVLVTYTIRHKRGDDLGASVKGLLAARAASRSGRWAVQFKDRFGVVGSVRALEVTHGQNGWHPHLHELLFVAGGADQEQIGAQLRERWASMVGKAGLRDVNSHGVDVQIADLSVTEYVAKFGRERSWTEAHELTKAVTKQARSGGRTPSELLAAATWDEDAAARRLWVEYARTFKGKRQLCWSRGLRDELGLDAEKSDEELVAERQEPGQCMGLLSRRDFALVVAADLRFELLDLAAYGHRDRVTAVLLGLGCSLPYWDLDYGAPPGATC